MYKYEFLGLLVSCYPIIQNFIRSQLMVLRLQDGLLYVPVLLLSAVNKSARKVKQLPVTLKNVVCSCIINVYMYDGVLKVITIVITI